MHTCFCSFQFDKSIDSEQLPELPKFIQKREDREEDFHYKFQVYYNQNSEKFLKAIPRISRNK